MELRSSYGVFDTRGGSGDQPGLVDYVLGFALGLALASLVVAFWWATRPPPPGLLWGDTVYTSEEQFKGYLDEKGLSYETWVERHPHAAPWSR